jgi:hypothetical protein
MLEYLESNRGHPGEIDVNEMINKFNSKYTLNTLANKGGHNDSTYIRENNNTSNLYQKDTDVPVDIKEFLSGVFEQEDQKDLSCLEGNISIIDPEFLCDDKVNNNDIILCISNLDINNLDDLTNTQSDGKLVKRIAMQGNTRVQPSDIKGLTNHQPKRKKLWLLIIFIVFFIAIISAIAYTIISHKI